MIPEPRHDHSASYDQDGNIILPENDLSRTQRNRDAFPEVEEIQSQSALAMHSHLSKTASKLLKEGASQYMWSAKSAATMLKRGKTEWREARKNLWAFLMQPVWVPRRSKDPKQYSRITLFCFDSLRFGTTFAVIFAGLFLSMNYQSFWAIVTTRINPIEHARNVQALTETVDATLREKLLKSPALAVAGQEQSDLLGFLPDVGPPENRIIIPKLGLNVPLVAPSYDALLREDWQQVEEDIQYALQSGVVHYPGTAKPGQAGNFFITGHSSYYPWSQGNYKTVFARLHELDTGDEYWVYHGGDKHRYIVRGKKEVRPSDVSVLDQPHNKRISTLMTCTPIGTTLRRLVITSEEVDLATGVALEVGEKGERVAQPKTKLNVLPI